MLFNIRYDDIKIKIKESEWIRNIFNKSIELCKPIMEEIRPYELIAPNVVGSAARAYGAKITMLITTGMVLEEDEYINKAKDMLLFVCEDKNVEYYNGLNGHLAVADAGFTYAVCYDLLEDKLNEQEKEVVKSAMNVLATYLYECNTVWRLPHSGVTSCNHNAVHHGALGLCAMILNNAEWLEFSFERVKRYLEIFADKTGFVTEGVSYTYYGLTSAVVFCEAYLNVTGIDIISRIENLKEVPNQFIEQMLPRYDALLSFNDHTRIIGNSAPFIYLVSRYGSCDGLYLWRQLEEGRKTFGSGIEDLYKNGIVFPFILHWANEKMPSVPPSVLNRPLSKKFDSGRCMMRTAWDDEMATFVSFTSGKDLHRGHNHPDQNSFTAYALGEEFLIEPGSLACDSRSHNIVMVNSIGQYFGCSHGEITEFKDYGRYVKVTGDATEAYVWEGDNLVGYAVRYLLFIRYPHPVIIIRDDIQTENDKDNFYEFMMHTLPQNEFYEKDGSVYVKGCNYGNLCRVSMVYPENVDIKIFDKVERSVFHYKKTQDLSKHHKEALFSTTARSPFFTSVITFAENEEELPCVHCTGDGNSMKLNIEFHDGYIENVDINRFNIEVKTELK